MEPGSSEPGDNPERINKPDADTAFNGARF